MEKTQWSVSCNHVNIKKEIGFCLQPSLKRACIVSDEKILLAAIWLPHNDMLYKISNNLSDAATVVAYRVTAKKMK